MQGIHKQSNTVHTMNRTGKAVRKLFSDGLAAAGGKGVQGGTPDVVPGSKTCGSDRGVYPLYTRRNGYESEACVCYAFCGRVMLISFVFNRLDIKRPSVKFSQKLLTNKKCGSRFHSTPISIGRASVLPYSKHRQSERNACYVY